MLYSRKALLAFIAAAAISTTPGCDCEEDNTTKEKAGGTEGDEGNKTPATGDTDFAKVEIAKLTTEQKAAFETKAQESEAFKKEKQDKQDAIAAQGKAETEKKTAQDKLTAAEIQKKTAEDKLTAAENRITKPQMSWTQDLAAFVVPDLNAQKQAITDAQMNMVAGFVDLNRKILALHTYLRDYATMDDTDCHLTDDTSTLSGSGDKKPARKKFAGRCFKTSADIVIKYTKCTPSMGNNNVFTCGAGPDETVTIADLNAQFGTALVFADFDAKVGDLLGLLKQDACGALWTEAAAAKVRATLADIEGSQADCETLREDITIAEKGTMKETNSEAWTGKKCKNSALRKILGGQFPLLNVANDKTVELGTETPSCTTGQRKAMWDLIITEVEKLKTSLTKTEVKLDPAAMFAPNLMGDLIAEASKKGELTKEKDLKAMFDKAPATV